MSSTVSMVKDAFATETKDVRPSSVISAIRDGKWRERVELVRQAPDKKTAYGIKTALPAVLWSGAFRERKNEALAEPSGLLCADLDKLNGQLRDARARLCGSPYLWGLFTSPSGDGLKAVFRVPPDGDKHRESFRAVERHVKEYTGVQIDQSCKDVARLCFVSYDPDAYHNPQAVEIEPLPEPEKPKAIPNAAVDLGDRQRIANELLGAIEWESESSGLAVCPGKHMHTSGDKARDCRVDLDGAPTVHCFHNSCRGILDDVNHELRSRISKAERAKSNPKERAEVAGEVTPTVAPRPLGELLDAICAFIRRFVVFPRQEQPVIIATWIIHTWLFDAFDYTPYLFIFSASKRSGKSRVLEVIEQLARNPLLTEGASTAALLRSNDESNPPTILLDEVDTIYGKKGDAEAESTRQFLNAGYRRGSKFLRCIGQGADISVKEFPAFCPKTFAGIDRCLPDTVLDRCLPIELVRQLRNEKAERFRRREVEAVAAPIRAELEALQTPSLIDVLKEARPALPIELNDRAQDISEPLAAIADYAGGKWPGLLRSAVVQICACEEDADLGVKLLGALKSLFEGSETSKLATIDILRGLVAIEDDAPWAQWYEQDLKQESVKKAGSHLARKLKRYNIKSSKIRFGEDTAQGYQRAQFEAVWARYLPAPYQENGTNGTNGTLPNSTRDNVVPTSVPLSRNVPLSPAEERNADHEGKCQMF